MSLHLPDWPVSQALVLLKDQTLSCLFITLILFSTWLYYLLGLPWERQRRTVVLSIRFLPPEGDVSTRASSPWSLHRLVLPAPPGTGGVCAQSLAPLSGGQGSLGAREAALSRDTQGSSATGWPEGPVVVSRLAPGRSVATTLYPLSPGFFLSPAKNQHLGSVWNGMPFMDW